MPKPKRDESRVAVVHFRVRGGSGLDAPETEKMVARRERQRSDPVKRAFRTDVKYLVELTLIDVDPNVPRAWKRREVDLHLCGHHTSGGVDDEPRPRQAHPAPRIASGAFTVVETGDIDGRDDR